MKINLHTIFWDSKNDERNNEIIDSFNKNISLNIFDKIFIYLEQDTDKLNHIKNSKIKIIHLYTRPTYQLIFDTSNILTNSDEINILSNSDIIFDKTIKLCKTIKNNYFYCITRYELDNKLFWNPKEDDNISKEFTYSQDTWIWLGECKIKHSNFNLGIPGCDNKIAFDAFTVGYKLLNPCYDIKTYHNHKSDIRNGSSDYKNYTKNQLKPCLLLKPSILDDFQPLGLLDDAGTGACLFIEQKND